MTNNNLLFEMSMILNDNSSDFFKLIIDMLPFKANQMTPATAHKKTKYNEKVFYSELLDALKQKTRFSTSISKDFNNTFMLRYDDISNVITIIIFVENYVLEKRLIDAIDTLFCQFTIITALIRNQEDGLLSSAYKISSYERRGIDTSNLKKKINTPFKDEIIDIEQFSGHSHEYGGIQFTSTYIMWFGNDFFKFVPQETLTSFKECISNETLENGTIRIQLYENINDYNSEEADHNQWAFRRHTNIDKIAEEWHLKYCKTPPGDFSGANMIIEQGNFEHGGVKLVKAYYDANNKSTPKKKAFKVVLTEYNSSNKVVFQKEELL